MNLKTAKLVVFALFMEQFEGVTAKSPRWAREMWEVLEQITSLETLEAVLLPDMLVKFGNYCKVWGKVQDGLSEQAPAAAAVEAKNGSSSGSQQSESVIVESKDVGSVEEVVWLPADAVRKFDEGSAPQED